MCHIQLLEVGLFKLIVMVVVNGTNYENLICWRNFLFQERLVPIVEWPYSGMVVSWIFTPCRMSSNI